MFVRVKYGDNETLLCNPSCTIVNLMSSIKTRTGHVDNDVIIDLTDETGFLFTLCRLIALNFLLSKITNIF